MGYTEGISKANWAVGKAFFTKSVILLNGTKRKGIDSGSVVQCESLENGVLLFKEYATRHEWTARNDDVFLLLEEDIFLSKHIKDMSKKQVAAYTQYAGTAKSMSVFGTVLLLMGVILFLVLSFFSSMTGYSMWLTMIVTAVFIGFSVFAFCMRHKNKKSLKELKTEITEIPYTSILG